MRMMSRATGCIIALAVICTLFASCSNFLGDERESVMPPGWSDRFLDRVQAQQSPKTSIAVMDFQAEEKLPKGIKINPADMLVTSLVQTGKFDVIERERLKRILDEQKLSLSTLFTGGFASTPMIDPKTAPAIGKLLGVEALVFGAVTSAATTKIDKFAYEVERVEVGIDVRAANTETGQIIFSQDALGTYETKVFKTAGGEVVSGALDLNLAYKTATQEAVRFIGQKIADLFPLLGLVVRVSDDQIYLDVGEQRGVRTGQKFVVFRKGREIVHPETNRHLGWEKEILGTVMIFTIEREMSIAKLVKLKDANRPFKPGDLVISAR